VVEYQRPLPAVSRPPEEIVAEAHKKAMLLKDIVTKTNAYTEIRGKKYLQVEAWQTIGQFYGLSACVKSAEPVEINGVTGFKAVCEIVNNLTGMIEARAESHCMRDEQRWASADTYAVASMAQTRSVGKAFRTRLSWVVALAGYEPTPYEEMPVERVGAAATPAPNPLPIPTDLSLHPATQSQPRTATEASGDVAFISPAQAKRFFAIWKEHVGDTTMMKEFMVKCFNITSSKEIPKSEYEKICSWVSEGKAMKWIETGAPW